MTLRVAKAVRLSILTAIGPFLKFESFMEPMGVATKSHVAQIFWGKCWLKSQQTVEVKTRSDCMLGSSAKEEVSDGRVS